MKATTMDEAKVIWMYWAQGWDNAPSLVKKCRRSWEDSNPDYQVIALDDLSVGEYLNIPSEIRVNRPDITVQKISNLIRIGILAKHGGVWADATLMCSKPLRAWLPEYFSTGFFAFRNPGKDRMFSSWFMASEPGNKLSEQLFAEYSTFLATNSFTNQNNSLGLMLRSIFRKKWNRNVNTTINWHSDFAKNVLKTYPYYIFHYTFNKVIMEDAECRHIWESAKPYLKDDPRILKRLSRRRKNKQKAIDFVFSEISPMHKLNWRKDMDTEFWKEVLGALELARQPYI